jgi:hypothetical protein
MHRKFSWPKHEEYYTITTGRTEESYEDAGSINWLKIHSDGELLLMR